MVRTHSTQYVSCNRRYAYDSPRIQLASLERSKHHLDLVTGDTHTIHFAHYVSKLSMDTHTIHIAHYVSKLSMFYERHVDITCTYDTLPSKQLASLERLTGFSLRSKHLQLASVERSKQLALLEPALPCPVGKEVQLSIFSLRSK